MSKLFRYIDVLKRTRLGFDLPPAGLWNYLKHKISPYSAEIGPTSLAPITVTLFITDRCNLSCRFCCRGMMLKAKANDWQSLEMTVETANQVLDLPITRRALAVALAGGEPLLNQALPGIIRSVKQRKKQCGIVTNGILLRERLMDLKKERADEVIVSIYDDTIEKLTKILPQVCPQITVNTSYVLTRSTLENEPHVIDDVISLCRESGCRSLKFNVCVPFDGNESETFFDDCEAYRDLMRKQRERNDSFKIFFPEPPKRIISTPDDKACRLPWQKIQVDALGRGFMCCGYTTSTGSDLYFDAFAQNDKESFNSPRMTSLRKAILANNTAVPEFCRSCPHISGGSFAAHV